VVEAHDDLGGGLWSRERRRGRRGRGGGDKEQGNEAGGGGRGSLGAGEARKAPSTNPQLKLNVERQRRSLTVMGQPVVHFEVIGKDGARLQSYYADLFGWQIDSDNQMNYGIVQRDGNTNSEGAGIGGGVGSGPEGYEGHVTFYVEVPDAEAALAKAEELGGTRVMGPDQVMEGLVIGQFADPEGHVVGVVQGRM
jgi:predicted enzyme related to lactoylglutathione lyase